MTPARASGVSFLENEMALRSVLVPEPGCQGGRAPGPMQALKKRRVLYLSAGGES